MNSKSLLSCNFTVEIIKKRLFIILPILDGEQKQISFGQSNHIVETTHARPGYVSNKQFWFTEHGLVYRVAHGILNATVLVLKRGYGTSILVIVVLILWVDRNSWNRIEFKIMIKSN